MGTIIIRSCPLALKMLDPYISEWWHECLILKLGRVHAKNEFEGLVITWVYNLFVMWALGFLPWIVPSIQTQLHNLYPMILSHFPITALLALSLFAFPSLFEPSPSFSFSSLIYSARLMEGLWLLEVTSGYRGPIPLSLRRCLVRSGSGSGGLRTGSHLKGGVRQCYSPGHHRVAKI